VSVKEQAATIVERLRRARAATFRSLAADAPDMITKVARFLALLELFREGAVAFEQVTPLGELTIRWTGTDDGEIEVEDEYDDHAEPEPDPPQPEPAEPEVVSDPEEVSA
jgi:segregation and condensation protein A